MRDFKGQDASWWSCEIQRFRGEFSPAGGLSNGIGQVLSPEDAVARELRVRQTLGVHVVPWQWCRGTRFASDRVAE